MEYISVKDTAEKWGISVRRVQILCGTGRIEGATKIANVWMVPRKADKPKEQTGGPPRRRRVLSLFSGCGGMDLGFEGDFSVLQPCYNKDVHPKWSIKQLPDGKVLLPKTRFKTVFANDIRPDAKRAWSHYFSAKGHQNTEYRLASIVDLVKKQRTQKRAIFPRNIDVVTGGFPCQDFSISGKRLGLDSQMSHSGHKIVDEVASEENRGQLYIWMKEVVQATKPKIFIAENVKGLVNLKDVKEIVQHDFAGICQNGYLVMEPQVLHAANYGVPQSRERVFFIGFLKEALTEEALHQLSQERVHRDFDPYPPATHYRNGEAPSGGRLPAVTTGQILGDLPEPHSSEDLSQQRYSKAKYMGRHCQGQTEVNLAGLAPTIRSEHHGNIEYRRLNREHGGTHLEELDAGLPERRLSVRECARIQTFPDEYEFVIPAGEGAPGVSASDAYKLIGNAVPPLLAYHLARSIEEKWTRYFGEEV